MRCARICGALLAFAVLASAASPSLGQDEQVLAPFVVGDIRIEGLQRVSAAPVFGALPLSVGDAVDAAILQDAIRALFATGLFRDIRMDQDLDTLVIHLVEHPTISSINIDGNKALKSEDLLASLADNGLAEGQIFKPATLEGLSRALQREYLSQGHYGASITPKIEQLPRNRVSVEILVDEGKKATIRRINIVGNEAFGERELLSIFDSGVAGRLAIFSSKNKYAREKLSSDLERLETFYLDRGYLQFAISSTQISLSTDRRSVFITINVDEGDIYRVNEVHLLGDLVNRERVLRSLVVPRRGEVFSQARMNATREYMNTILGNLGYSFAEIETSTEVIDSEQGEKRVDITYMINPKQRNYVRRISFIGNQRTRDEVLRREMRQLEAAPASDNLIEAGRVRLSRLGFFESVEVETDTVPDTADQLDVTYRVKEQPSGSIGGSIGYSETGRFNASFELQEQNFLGSGNALSLGYARDRFRESYSVLYNNPYFTEDGVSAGFSIFSRTADYSEINTSFARFRTDAAGLRVDFGYPLTDISRLNLSLGYESLRAGDENGPPEIRSLGPHNESYGLYKMTMGWRQFALNRGILATAGYSQGLTVELALPGSDLSYGKFTYEGQRFFRLNRTLRLRLRTTLGYGFSIKTNNGRLPFFENYHAGGFGSVRNFEPNSLGPRESESGGNGRHDPIGGNVLITGSAELLLPMPFLQDTNRVQLVAFADAGNVFDTDCSMSDAVVGDDGTVTTPAMVSQAYCYAPDLAELRYSLGFQLSWISGFGPLTFSIGRGYNSGTPMTNVVPEGTKFFEFSLGRTF